MKAYVEATATSRDSEEGVAKLRPGTIYNIHFFANILPLSGLQNNAAF